MSVNDGRIPRRNYEPWPADKVPQNDLERLIASVPPPGLSIAHAELSERLGREAAENLSLKMENRQQAKRIEELERELEQARAAFIGSENARKDAERAAGVDA